MVMRFYIYYTMERNRCTGKAASWISVSPFSPAFSQPSYRDDTLFCACCTVTQEWKSKEKLTMPIPWDHHMHSGKCQKGCSSHCVRRGRFLLRRKTSSVSFRQVRRMAGWEWDDYLYKHTWEPVNKKTVRQNRWNTGFWLQCAYTLLNVSSH